MCVKMVMFSMIIEVLFISQGSFAHGQSVQRTEVSPKLMAELQADKLRLSPPLLVDRDALVRQLNAVVMDPPGKTAEVREFVRVRAIVALGLYGGKNSLPTLLQLSHDEGESFRRYAIAGLGRTKTAQGIAEAAKFLRDEDELLREAAIDALGHADRKEALAVLEKFNASEDKLFIQRKRNESIQRLRNVISRQSKQPSLLEK